MRKTYRFSHSIVQGGYVYAHKILDGRIENKEGLRNALNAIAKKFKLLDVTIKIYDSTFFFFFMARNIKPTELINLIQKHMSYFGAWDKDYIYGTVYDLQEEYVRKDLKEWGFDYDSG